MTIAVTGANGLLGSYIIRQLLATQQNFIALKRKHSDTSLLADVDEQIQWRDADVTDPVQLDEALQGVTHVIHAAAIVSFDARDEEKIFKVNVEGTKNIVNACLANNVVRLLHVSSVAALGRNKNQTLIDESNKWVDNKLNSRYASSKYKAELEIYRSQQEGISTVIINPSVILAAADWNKSSAQLFKYVYDERKFYIDGYLNYVDVRDVASIACMLLQAPVENQRFILNAGNVSFIDFFSQTAALLQKQPPRIKLSRGMLKLAAFAEMLRARIMRTNPLITFETARLAGTKFNYDNKKIMQKHAVTFTPLYQTLQWCCKNYKQKINPKK